MPDLSANTFCFTAVLGLAVAGTALRAQPANREENFWPVSVRQSQTALRPETWTGAGPFLFRRPATEAEGFTAGGFRPFWVQVKDAEGDLRAGYFLYPLFSYAADKEIYRWSLFELVRRWDRRAGAGVPGSPLEQRGEFEVFPFWFSRESGDPEMSYRALFPLHGTVKNKLTFERLSWTLFPLYVENERRGAVTTYTPWPFLRFTRGAEQGWGVWPFYAFVERPGVSRHESYLWPLGFNSIRHPAPDDPPGAPPRRDVGALPFYARHTGPGYINEDFFWPFFGYTDRTLPVRYNERRYLWPLFLQGRGEKHFVNRWAPFYTHSIVSGYDKRWFAWPLLRRAHWTDDGIEHTRTQLLYFFFWNEEQRRAGRLGTPSASLTHLWPLLSHWDNGAGRRQWQLFSPLEIFFPGNEKVRLAWTPLLAIARHDRRAPGDHRTSLLWNAVTWERRAAEERSEFHLGPLLGVTSQGGEKRIAIGNGLFGFRRSVEKGWRMFWLDFPAKPAAAPTSSK